MRRLAARMYPEREGRRGEERKRGRGETRQAITHSPDPTLTYLAMILAASKGVLNVVAVHEGRMRRLAARMYPEREGRGGEERRGEERGREEKRGDPHLPRHDPRSFQGSVECDSACREGEEASGKDVS